MTIKLKYIVIGISIVIVDIAIYILLGLLLMNYDDFYDESKGEYWSLTSMNMTEKATYVGLNVWNIINVLGLIYFVYKLIKRLK